MIYDGETGAVFGPLALGKNSPGAMHGMQAICRVVEVLKLVKLNRLQEGMYTYNNTDKQIYTYIYISYMNIYDICIPDCIFIDTIFSFRKGYSFFFFFFFSICN